MYFVRSADGVGLPPRRGKAASGHKRQMFRETRVMSSALPFARPSLADHFFYPPVGRLERQWDLYVEGTGYGTWPSELDPVWHPQPFYYCWMTVCWTVFRWRT